MMWARDADLNPIRSPNHGSLIEQEFARRTGRRIEELEAAAPPPNDPPPRLPTRTESQQVIGPPQVVGPIVRPTSRRATAGIGTSPLLLAAIALPLAYVGYSEWARTKKKKR